MHFPTCRKVPDCESASLWYNNVGEGGIPPALRSVVVRLITVLEQFYRSRQYEVPVPFPVRSPHPELPEDFPGNRECPEDFDLVPARKPDRCHVIARVLQSPDPDKADALPVADDKMERETVSRFKSKYQQPPCPCLFLCLPDRNDRPVPPGHAVSRCVQVPAGVPGLNGGKTGSSRCVHVPAGVPGLNGGKTGSSRCTPAGRGGTLCGIRLLLSEPVIQTAGRT